MKHLVGWFLTALAVELGALLAVAALRRQDFVRPWQFAALFACECLLVAIWTRLRCDPGRGPAGFAIGTTLGAALVIVLAWLEPGIPVPAGPAWSAISAIAVVGYQIGVRAGPGGRNR